MPWSKTVRGTVSAAVSGQLAAAQQWNCGQCHKLLPAAYEIDHVKPLWAGGADAAENMWALCPNCHAKKTQQESIDRRLQKESAEKQDAYDNREDVVVERGTMMRCSLCLATRKLGTEHPVCWAIEEKYEMEASAARAQSIKRALQRFSFNGSHR